jgi:hypothetical protein
MDIRKPFIKSHMLPTPPAGWHNYSYEVLSDGSLALIRVNKDFSSIAENLQGSTWSESKLRLSTFDGRHESLAAVVPASRWPCVDRMANGHWVVAASRSGKDEMNINIFTSEGLLASQYSSGDGIRQILCGTDGRIWVSYSDEGIGGGGSTDDTWTPARTGLAAFSPTGECSWSFDYEDYWIVDCYAMGENGGAIWVCTYPDFPLFRVSGGAVTRWTNSMPGASAIAVCDDLVILAGSYSDEGDLTLLKLGREDAVCIAETRLSGISELGYFSRGRNGVLHVVSGRRWLRIAIDDWKAALS